mmetsp:Transcript_23172/g.48635  ORF Transcript_23172/g.48635 Transcript_23172/m.48635 type:complete len:245 (+) Transcript_23172:55-789(+)
MQSAALAFEKRGNIGLDSVCSQYLVLLQSSPMRKDARRRGLDVLVMNGWETSKRQQDSSRSSKMPKIKVEKGYYAVESVAFAAPEASIAKSVQRYFAWSSPISRGYPSSASPRLPSASAAFSSATISASVGTAMACCGDSGDTAKESTSAASSRSCSSTACSVSLAGELMKGSLSPSLALLLLLSPIPEPPFAPTYSKCAYFDAALCWAYFAPRLLLRTYWLFSALTLLGSAQWMARRTISKSE